MPDEPSRDEEHQQPEASGAQSTSSGFRLGGQHTYGHPSEYQADQSPHKRPNFFNRVKRNLTGHRAKEFYRNPMVWIEIVALAVLVCYSRYAGQQAKIMGDTLTEIKAQTPAITESANAANSAATTANQTLQEMQAEQRPWVMVKGVKLTTFEAGKPIEGLIQIGNTGKTIALNVTAAASIFVSSDARSNMPKLGRVKRRRVSLIPLEV